MFAGILRRRLFMIPVEKRFDLLKLIAHPAEAEFLYEKSDLGKAAEGQFREILSLENEKRDQQSAMKKDIITAWTAFPSKN